MTETPDRHTDQQRELLKCDFRPSSESYVSMRPTHAGIIPDRRPEQTDNHEQSAKELDLVGVFADDMPQNIITRVALFGLKAVVLEGKESPTLIANLRQTIVPDIAPSLLFIKAVSIAKEQDLSACLQYIGIADHLLIRAEDPAVGQQLREKLCNLLQASDRRKTTLCTEDNDRIIITN